MYLRGFDSGRELLKWLAIITMTIDHIGVILYPNFFALRWIGRLSFPLFAYLLILGMEDTRNIRKYFTRLFIFALISQIPFFLAIGSDPFEKLNIFFTLSSGLFFVYFFKIGSILAFIPLFLSLFLPFDYSIYGLALIGCMYILTKNIKFGIVLVILLNSMFLISGPSQILSLLSLPFIVFHNNGSLTGSIKYSDNFSIPKWRKYFFYVYYPSHLTLLYLIQQIFF